jgi:large subunit ribosomal protein L6
VSKLARKPLPLLEGVTAEIKDSRLLLKGHKGELTIAVPPEVRVEETGGALKIEGRDSRLVGLFTSLAGNAIQGVSEGFRKELELVGVGYKVEKVGGVLRLSLGFSHPIEYKVREDVSVSVKGGNKIVVEGSDKQVVGQVAAEIRRLRPPEPYKGKGIRYSDEVVRRKSGKMKAVVGA